MFRLEKSFTFEASHQLPQHNGKCRRLHGHSWRGTIICEDYELITQGPKSGMMVDFYDLSQLVKPLLEHALDHHHLNETTGLPNPTSECLAKWVYDKLKPDLPTLVAIRIEETCTSAAEYRCPNSAAEVFSSLAPTGKFGEYSMNRTVHQFRVEQFMRLARQELPDHPVLPSEDIRRLRARLILEEAFETVKALGFSVKIGHDVNEECHFTYVADQTPDLVQIADGCADISVVTIGTLSACGIPDLPLLALVDDNNLVKFGPGHSFREDGKLIKPPDHKPPDIAGFLKSFE